MKTRLILASSSPFRRELIQRLHLEFEVVPPRIDEARGKGESACDMATRLAREKARRVAGGQAGKKDSGKSLLVIGSDQTVELDDDVLGKAGGYEAAVEQLSKLSGREVLFHTAVCLISSHRDRSWEELETVRVTFRRLDDQAIENYLRKERPYVSAGSFQAEGYGVTLVERIESNDPTALVGLPLIKLSEMLRKAGIELP